MCILSDAVVSPDSTQTTKVPCRPVYCRLYCAYGFRTDPTTGCQYCACNTQPPSCPPVLCRMYCTNGFKVNPTTGCQYCACQE